MTAPLPRWKTDPTSKGRITPGFLKRSIALAVGIAALALPASAGAATTIGSNLAGTPASSHDCGMLESCTDSHLELPASHTASGGLFAPSDGVVVRWRIKVGSETTPVALRITRPGQTDTRTGAGTGPAVTPATNQISTYDVRLPIKLGDALGIDCCATGPLRAYDGIPEAFTGRWIPRLQDGEPPRAAQFPPADHELLVNADIESDADCDGFGDETQDPSVDPAGCNPPQSQNRSLTLDANKNKVKKRKRVRLSGRVSSAARQAPCESGQTVELQRKRPSQATFTTFAQVQTDAQGSFSLKKKVKKTFQFRAQVVATATCTAALSNIEKVKVKKKGN